MNDIFGIKRTGIRLQSTSGLSLFETSNHSASHYAVDGRSFGAFLISHLVPAYPFPDKVVTSPTPLFGSHFPQDAFGQPLNTYPLSLKRGGSVIAFFYSGYSIMKP